MAEIDPGDRSPVVEALADHWPQLLRMIGLLASAAIVYFIVFVYATTFLTEQMHFSTADALDITTANLVVAAFVALGVGYAADRVGYREMLGAGAVATLLLAGPLWYLMHEGSLAVVFLGQLGFAAVNAIVWSLSLTALAGLVPARVRCSAVAMGYNAGMAIFGGTTPFVATYLVSRTSDDYAPVYYAMAAALVALVVVSQLPRVLAYDRSVEVG